MRSCMFAVAAALAASTALAHGPQIQITFTEGKIATRNIVGDSSYSTSLTDPKSVYVMPLAESAGIWRAQPDRSYVGWPGFAHGYGFDAATNPAPFPLGSNFRLEFLSGLELWEGGTFVDAGATEVEAYRGTSATPSAVARTSDTAPFASLPFPGGNGVTYTNADAHSTVNYQMLGDGSSIFSSPADGIYLLNFRLTNTDPSVAASDPFYFVLHKNAAPVALAAAIESLEFGPELVQFVPEPPALLMVALACVGILSMPRWPRD